MGIIVVKKLILYKGYGRQNAGPYQSFGPIVMEDSKWEIRFFIMGTS